MPGHVSYLSVEEATFAPPPKRSGVPFWDQAWIAPDLHELLFGARNGEVANTYLIVDATLRTAVTGIFDLDQLPVPVSCLFQGSAERDFGASAPYLIDLSLPATGPTAFHRNFFLQHWERGTGIVLRSKAPMTAIRSHFRKFTLIKSSQGRSMFFRFWETNTLYDYFSLVSTLPERAKDLFCLKSGEMVDLVLGHAEIMARGYIVRPNVAALKTAGYSRGMLRLLPEEEQALYRGVLRGYAKQLERKLASEGGEKMAPAAFEARVFEYVCQMRQRGVLDLAEIERRLRWEL